MQNRVIEFLRKKDFKFIEDIGEGAFGKTILLKDEIINELFVCKKYSPAHEAHKEQFFDNFKNEIKLLHLLYHKNIVRVFNYYLYPEQYTGYILMEHVNGLNIEEYLQNNPENLNEVFTQTIDGFKYLEDNNILHRDIRPYNLLVNKDGIVKVIDFGFGKKVHYETDYEKSISLNWWCEPPMDFREHKYNFQTEIYFIGKLFEKIILENEIEHFNYRELLERMVAKKPEERIVSFNECYKSILLKGNEEIDFSYHEIESYRSFSESLAGTLTKIEHGTRYIDDVNEVIQKIDELYKRTMLEECLPENSLLLRCFLKGSYYFRKNNYIYVTVLHDFIKILKETSVAKKKIILNNLHTRLDAIQRYSTLDDEDDIPF